MSDYLVKKKISIYPRLEYRKEQEAKKKQDTNLGGLELCERLGALPFWCGDTTLHLTKENYHEDYCCLTHAVGLPEHPGTGQAEPLTPFQVDFFNAVNKAVAQPDGMSVTEWKRLAHKFHLNKGRQMGFTEIVLRVIQYYCFNRYAGYKVGIIAATNGKLAGKDLRRFYRLFAKIPTVLTGTPKSNVIQLVNDTTVEAFPASEEALTGDTNYKCIFMDEAAKWKLVDDTPVFNSVMPIVRSNGSDLFLVSTPKGPLKMFYKIYKDPQDFVMLEYDIWAAEGNMYTKTQIENMIATSKEDPNQEYLCKFTIGQDSIFGLIGDDDRGIGWSEWDVEEDDEDDGYVEDDDADW